MNQSALEAAVIFESYLPDAFQQALNYAGEDGFVASLPQLLHARSGAANNNEIWNTPFFTTNSEESIATTAQGNPVVVVVHGGGIFGSPDRFRKLYHANVSRNCPIGFTGLFGARITQTEARDVIEGRMPDGVSIPVIPFSEFRQGIANLPRHYAVVMDFDAAKNSITGNVPFDALKEDSLMIARAGGAETAAAYLDAAINRHRSDVMGSWHYYRDVNPGQPQTRVLFLGGTEGGAQTEVYRDLTSREQGYIGIWGTHYRVPIEAEAGVRGDSAMINMGRYVAVAPRDMSTSLRHLSFEDSESRPLV